MLRCVLLLAFSALGGCALSHRIEPEGRPIDAGVPPDPAFDAGIVIGGRDAGAPPIDPPAPCRDLGPQPTPDEATALLAWVQRALLGRWSGTRHASWDGDQAVTVTFLEGGTYEASCEGACAPFYWGAERPSGRAARYEIDDTTTSGTASGRLWPVFGDSPADFYSTWSGTIDGLRIDPTGTTLTLRFWDSEGRGPITFDVARRCE